ACREAVCGGGGSDESQITVANGNHTMPGRSHRIAVTNDEAENAPRLTVPYGEDLNESKPPLERRVETHTAKAQNSSTPVPWRWRSRPARIRGPIDRAIRRRRNVAGSMGTRRRVRGSGPETRSVVGWS